MKVKYDSEVDAAYVYFNGKISPGEVKQTITLNNSLIVDLDRKGKLLGLEILDASRNLTKQALGEFSHSKKPHVTTV
ncbi:MAG: DUF2283 domain-containing protein [Candidatus Altiarchaeota archaeon]